MTSFAAVEDLQEIQYLALDELDVSPFNPRKTLDPVKVAELAESIRKQDFLVPLLIRKVPIEGEVVAYHIVAGSRRAAAGKIAGKTEAPCIVREMTDDEARELAITDNLQREGMEPLEEAQSFSDAMTLAFGRMMTVQELAVRLGKSPIYINSRLTLLDAMQDVQAALRNGLIDVGHALELARLSESEQERLLSWLDIGYVIAEDREEDEEPFYEDDAKADPLAATGVRRTAASLQELRSHIGRTTLRILGEAPFDPNDADLVKEAGSCAPCLKRSGANQLLFSDVRGADVCTDRNCFDGKVKAFVAWKMAEAKAAKKPLHQITEEWSKKGPQIHYLHNGVREAGAKRCGFLVEAIHVDGRNIGKVIEICIGADCKVHGSRSSSSSRAVPSEKAKADRKALLGKVKDEKAYRARLFKELIAKPVSPEPTDEMVRALVLFAFTRIDSTKHAQIAEALAWDKDVFGWQSGEKKRLAKLATLTQADAIRIALVALEANELTVHEHDVHGKTTEIGLEKVAKLIGVDPVSVRAPGAKPAVPKSDPVKAAKPVAKKSAPAKKAAAKKAVKKAAKKAVKPAKKKAVRK